MKQNALKQRFSIALLFLFLFVQSPLLLADDPFIKLGRGISNIALSPAEWILQINELRKEYDPFTATSIGIFKGAYHFGLRLVTGAYDVATFPIPIPREYRGLIEPRTTGSALRKEWYGY